MVIDVPEVKGNPKGLMRTVNDNKPEEPANVLWFSTTTIGKQSLRKHHSRVEGRDHLASPSFHKEGAFAEWQKEPKKRYFIFRYKLDGEKLVVDAGSETVVKDLMKAEKIEHADNGYFKTPTGWFAKYLEKNDPDKIFDGNNVTRYTRPKM